MENASQVEAVKKQLEASQQLREELETASAQRALQLTQMRMQFDQLKNASNQVLGRCLSASSSIQQPALFISSFRSSVPAYAFNAAFTGSLCYLVPFPWL